jgi:glycosyltransferase involved in cell wall biosynthesis
MTERALHIGVDGRELLGQPTGVGRYIRCVLDEWTADAGTRHRISVFLNDDPPADLARLLRTVGWHVDRAARAGTVWEQTRLPRAIAQAKVDVFFAAGYTAPLWMPCPFVVAIYDVSFFANPAGFEWREGVRRRWLTRRAAQRAASVITISEFSAAEIVRYLRIERSQIRLAPPGGRASAVGHRPVLPERVVLFVGSLFGRRHIPELLHGFALARQKVPDARLVLIGANRTNPRIDPRQLASDLGVASWVDWRDHVTDAELDRQYAAARVFAFLSDYEGFAMTPMEALAHGVPPVMLDTPVAREVYGQGARFVPLASQAIAEALVSLLTDDGAHRTLVASGQARLRALSWPRTAGTILRALEEAAGQP